MKIDQKTGILGGGQLGKMLALAAGKWHLPLWALDADANFPAAPYVPRFVEGDFKNKEDVLAFGREVDVLTIEIEHVNIEALHQLEAEGKRIHPRPGALEIIKDKGRQKQFFADHDFPTAPFTVFEDEKALLRAVEAGEVAFPFVQKTTTAGYDGRGVSIIRSVEDLETRLLEGTCLAEELAPIDKELAVIAARNERGELAAFPAVEMVFNPDANLVELLLCPAQISPAVEAAAENLAKAVIEAFDICGLLAVELFLTKNGEIWVNEVAPRPHNSGHHTIEACVTSQFEQHLRGVLNWPLGSTELVRPAAMVNLLGAEGYEGAPVFEGLEECLRTPGVYVHNYGKTTTKPFRKMGHVTVVGKTVQEVLHKAHWVKDHLRVIAAS
ncbi:MAG TPA: 5-(carboxyamino)imidazole ribonucleotide synthase [Flavilitoribacter sp.]|nr:5-(carboxyamino)imidazole ribonucleotide synthase [Flavilitoribacter sp.]HMQ88191.1 5-(carboxyamino)imidazole ribonucleotide synthase [Flavilitoribacter sp.]